MLLIAANSKKQYYLLNWKVTYKSAVLRCDDIFTKYIWVRNIFLQRYAWAGAVFEEAAFYINYLSYTKLTCATGFLAFQIALEGKTLMIKQLMWWFSIEDLNILDFK